VINPICEIKLLNNGNKNQNDINEIIIEDKNFSNYKLISMFVFLSLLNLNYIIDFYMIFLYQPLL
jgi:hypothetical protein